MLPLSPDDALPMLTSITQLTPLVPPSAPNRLDPSPNIIDIDPFFLMWNLQSYHFCMPYWDLHPTPSDDRTQAGWDAIATSTVHALSQKAFCLQASLPGGKK